MTIQFNRTSNELVIMARTDADQKKIGRLHADMANTGRAYQVESTASAFTLRVPMAHQGHMETMRNVAEQFLKAGQ